jgi:hypothetical protein
MDKLEIIILCTVYGLCGVIISRFVVLMLLACQFFFCISSQMVYPTFYHAKTRIWNPSDNVVTCRPEAAGGRIYRRMGSNGINGAVPKPYLCLTPFH